MDRREYYKQYREQNKEAIAERRKDNVKREQYNKSYYVLATMNGGKRVYYRTVVGKLSDEEILKWYLRGMIRFPRHQKDIEEELVAKIKN